MSSSLPPIPADISVIAGGPLVGIMLNWGLWGILIVQLYIYHISFPNDTKAIKCLVYGLGALEIIQTFLATADGFHWFAAGFGNMEQLNETFISAWDAPFLDSLISLVVQLFFCYRIWVLQRSYILSGIVTIVSLTQSAAGMAVGVKGHLGEELSKIPTFIIEQSIWLGGSALADTLIAIFMTIILLRGRDRGIPETNNIIMRIVRLTVETNSLTAGVALLALIFYLAFPTKPTIVVPFSYVIGKLYSNTLLAIFNNRLLIQNRGVVAYSHFGTTADGLRFAAGAAAAATESTATAARSEPYNIKSFRSVDDSGQSFGLKSFNDTSKLSGAPQDRDAV